MRGRKPRFTKREVAEMCDFYMSASRPMSLAAIAKLFDTSSTTVCKAVNGKLSTTSEFEVIVSNIGTVYRGTNEVGAIESYKTYVEQSKADFGRAAGESVHLFCEGEPKREYVPMEEVEQ